MAGEAGAVGIVTTVMNTIVQTLYRALLFILLQLHRAGI